MYPNSEGLWVMRFLVDSIENEAALTAYLNILVRCNSLVNKYQLVKVRTQSCSFPSNMLAQTVWKNGLHTPAVQWIVYCPHTEGYF